MDTNCTDQQSMAAVVDQFYTPPLCVFGAIGNCLSVYVFRMTSSHRNQSSSYYLSALAISDLGFLINLFVLWLFNIGLDLMSTRFTCPLVMYLAQVSCFLSVWFVVAFTAERFCAVCYPLTRPAVCTVARAKRVILTLTIIALTGFSYVWVIADLVPDQTMENECGLTQRDVGNRTIGTDSSNNSYVNSTSLVCSVPPEWEPISAIASHVDTFMTLVLPFCIITFLNFRITLCVWKLKGQRETIVAVARLGPNPTVNLTPSPHNKQNSYIKRNGIPLPISPNCQHQAAQNGNGSHSGSGGSAGPVPVTNNLAPYRAVYHSSAAEVRVTKTLLLVSTVFLVLNLPSHAIRAFTFIHIELGGSSLDTMEAQQWANILFNTNFSVNFLLYCVSGRNFRKSLRTLCRRWDGRQRGRSLSKPTIKTRTSGQCSRKRNRRSREGNLYRPTSARQQQQNGGLPANNNHVCLPAPNGYPALH